MVYINHVYAKCLYLYSNDGFAGIQATGFGLDRRLIALKGGLSGTKTGS